MKKSLILFIVILFSVALLNAATTEDRASATLSYHGEAYYFWHMPSADMQEAGVRFTPADDCTLTSANFTFYNTVGSPTGITVHVYESVSNLPGTELGSVNVPIANLNFYPNATTVDLSSLNLNFAGAQDFFISYTVDNGVYQTTEVTILSDDGSNGANRSVYENGRAWLARGYEFLIEATIEYAQEPDPLLEIQPDSLGFGRTAIGGSKVETITLSNIGGGQVIINSITIFGNSQFSLWDENTYPDTLTNSESITFKAIYSPDAVGTNTSTITINETSVPAYRTTHNIPLTGEGYNHNSWADTTAVYDQSPMGNQGDYSWSAGTSDAAPEYLRADNFGGLSSPITSIDFWGINWYYDAGWHESPAEDPMSFDIKFYNNAISGYGPGTLVDSFSVNLTRTTVDSVTFSGGPVYKYTAELAHSVNLPEGWMSIQGTSVASPQDVWFLWLESPIGDYGATLSTDAGSTWETNNPDRSFALYSEVVLPPSDVAISVTGGNAVITWTSEAGKNYHIYSDTDPHGAFGTLAGSVTDGSGTFSDPITTSVKKFYKVTAYTGTRTNQLSHSVIIEENKSIKDASTIITGELKR